jgi:hypothetical protein
MIASRRGKAIAPGSLDMADNRSRDRRQGRRSRGTERAAEIPREARRIVGWQLRPAPCSVADHASIERVGRHRGRPRARKARDQGLEHHEHDHDRNQRVPTLPQLVQETWCVAGCHENAVMRMP